ncbi:MAG: hypothetical protein F6K54_01010 [Okeania sp. SIO3B5]|uniref:hypothetical protein n=1 Tax=Okeania sp. SIO3B5 TaxID=2607811 RepID=UPI00140175BE|nr:hypothetical protein [Okeania sp. SIO3B5]NEO51789.1 hypothetical protein [Okeania sp. SIO3B5]
MFTEETNLDVTQNPELDNQFSIPETNYITTSGFQPPPNGNDPNAIIPDIDNNHPWQEILNPFDNILLNQQSFDNPIPSDNEANIEQSSIDPLTGETFFDFFSSMFSFNRRPEITASLANDTILNGGTNTDGITSDPTVSGFVIDDGNLQDMNLQASLNTPRRNNFTDVSDTLNPDGSFSLDIVDLEQLYGGALTEGEHTLYLRSIDDIGRTSQVFSVDFELDRTLYGFVNMMEREVGLINTKTDEQVLVPLENIENYPGGRPQHVLIPPDEQTVYVTTDASDTDSANLVALEINGIDWSNNTADLTVLNSLTLEPVGTTSEYNVPIQVDPSQPIGSWTQPAYTQAHGTTWLPGSPYGYLTQWTDNKIRGFDRSTNQFLPGDSFEFGEATNQTHGVTFNPSGTVALGTGYYYDDDDIEIYSVDGNGNLNLRNSIELTSPEGNGAFTHYTAWADDRYAFTASMQFGPTSLTPSGQNIVGPSLWLLDTFEGTAERVVGTANTADESGIFRSPSDLGIAGDKLYVAEEDSLDNSFGDDGYISVYDISDINEPEFIKRFKPGEELPADFAIAHGLNVTPDEDSVYVASYASNYIVKIDTETDQVEKVFSSLDGLNMPHGGFTAGRYR